MRAVVATDPGQVRLRSAGGTVVTLVLALGVLVALTQALGQPITVALLGAVVAMISSVVVSDRTHRARIVTTVLTPLPAIASAGLAAVLQPYGAITDVGFVAVLFAATWVRRFGPRGDALGQIAFIAYFFVLFLRASLPQLPALAASVLAGVAVALLVRVALLPERPRRDLRRLTRALRAVCASAVSVAVTGALSSRTRGPAHARLDEAPLRRQRQQLGDTALLIEDWLDRHDAARHLSVDGRELSLRVLDGQLATEQLLDALAALHPAAGWPPVLDTVLAALDTVLRDEPADNELVALLAVVAAAAGDVDITTPGGRAVFAAAHAARTHTQIHRVSEQVAAASERPEATTTSLPASGLVQGAVPVRGLHPATRAAIQVAVATALATGVGELISPSRWYWAVLTAFLVFNGTASRGQILSRAWQRVLGTLGGVVAGVLLAAAVGNHAPLQLGLAVVCVFAAFYLVRVSNTLMVFFFTVLLALLYGLLGAFSVPVLELRIYETAAGAVVGIAAAFLVLPTATHSTVQSQLRASLGALEGLVRDSVAAVGTGTAAVDLVLSSRNLDDTLVELDRAAEPLANGFLPRVRTVTRLWLRVVRVVDGYARSLARAGHAAAAAPAPAPEVAAALTAAAEAVHTHVDALRTRLDGVRPAPVHQAEAALIAVLALDGRGVHDPDARPLRSAVHALARIDRALLELLEVVEVVEDPRPAREQPASR